MKIFKQKKSDSLPSRRQNQDSSRAERNELPKDSFRRGRTLTGSSSPRISSSNELKADLLSPRAQVHHLSHRRRHLFAKLVATVVAILLIYVFLGQLISKITISDSGSLPIPTDRQAVYIERINEYFASRPTERFYPSLQESTLNSYLRSEYPEVEDITMELSGELGQAQAQLTLRKPVARWTIRGNTQFVDSTGIVYGYNLYSKPPLEIIDRTGTSTQSGIVTSNRFLSFVGRVVGDLSARGYKVTKATIPALTTRQLEINIKGIPYRFKLTVDRLAGEQAEDITRIVPFLKRKGISPGYVDVRVEQKAFYR